MSGIVFCGAQRQSKQLNQARDEAIADGRRKAELYAKAAGARLGQVLIIVEEGTSPPQPPMQAIARRLACRWRPANRPCAQSSPLAYELTPLKLIRLLEP